jgi:hypothetical protein
MFLRAEIPLGALYEGRLIDQGQSPDQEVAPSNLLQFVVLLKSVKLGGGRGPRCDATA